MQRNKINQQIVTDITQLFKNVHAPRGTAQRLRKGYVPANRASFSSHFWRKQWTR